MAVTVRDRDAICDALERIRVAAEGIYSAGGNAHAWTLSMDAKGFCDQLSLKAPSAATGFVNIVTCLAAKVVDPLIDCRYHRQPGEGMPVPPSGPNCYLVGRPISEEVIAGWLRQQSYTAAGSGWQTRTFERPKPYTLDYAENIRPADFKAAFLGIYDRVEAHGESAEELLTYLFVKEIVRRDAQQIEIAVPSVDIVSVISQQLESHFSRSYTASGAARLPVLALHAVYQIIAKELRRYDGKLLLPLQQHSTADLSSGAIGDIEVADAGGIKLEGVEVKHDKPITPAMIQHATTKFKEHQVRRYYLLTTSTPCVSEADAEACKAEVSRIQATLGCQMIVNGVMPTIRYYLRLVSDPSEFFRNYASLLKADQAIKYEHRAEWNRIIEQQ